MNTQTQHAWHADDAMLSAYTAGRLGALDAASIEQHLLSCARCRGAIGSFVDAPALDASWLTVRRAIEQPALPITIRMARRLGLSERNSVLLAAAASLRTAWVSAAFVALGFAFAATRFTAGEGDNVWPFLLVAPLIPVLGVAASYDWFEDPLYALTATTPFGRTRLVLTRSMAVLVSCLPVAILLGLLLPGPDWIAAAWLGPALALIPVLMALASFIGPSNAAAGVALAWSGVVLGSVRHYGPLYSVERDRQLAYLALAVVSIVVLIVRSRRSRVGGVL